MTVTNGKLADWLRRQRQMSQMEMWIMADQFDLDGALSANQRGVAWHAQESILLSGIALFVMKSGQDASQAPDTVERACENLDSLARVNPAAAERAWSLWERAMPSASDIAQAIDLTLAFVRSDLGILAATSRDAAIKAWAVRVRVLRAVAKPLGVANSDDWYLRSSAAHQEQLDWYDEVLRVTGSD
jgi:hypothetical protein